MSKIHGWTYIWAIISEFLSISKNDKNILIKVFELDDERKESKKLGGNSLLGRKILKRIELHFIFLKSLSLFIRKQYQ